MTIVLGTQFYAGPPDAMRRQQQALDAVKALSGVEAVNMQWVDEICERPGIETVSTLKQDSQTVTGVNGRRKPIVPELLDTLAEVAAERTCRYFALFNADIVVTQAAIDVIQAGQRQTYTFSRMDVDEAGRELSIVTAGLDLFAFDVNWWRAHRGRFRPYIFGERCFDNVFAAIMMCHSDGLIRNRNGEIRHEAHAFHRQGAFDEHNVYLATLDAPYFSLWVAYREHLTAARAREASEAEELETRRSVFVFRPSLPARIWHAGRCLKARWRFRRRRARRARQSGSQ